MDIFKLIFVVCIGVVQSDSWHYYNQRRYFYGTETVDWDTAKQKCSDKGTSLASIRDRYESSFMKSVLATINEEPWIGLIQGLEEWCACDPSASCEDCRRSWVWDDGSPMDYDTYNEWKPNEPHADEGCARLTRHTRGWSGTFCWGVREYICKDDGCYCCSSPCVNGGTCEDDINEYRCNCVSGYTGIHCESDICECCSTPCENGAFCSEGVDRYTCECAEGYTGAYCETDIDDCARNLCDNRRCVDQVNSYACACSTGYTGQFCDQDINECASNPCMNNGTCIDLVNSYTCVCPLPEDMRNCERDKTTEDTTSKDSAALYGVIAGMVVFGVLFAVTLVAAVVIIKRRGTHANVEDNRYEMTAPIPVPQGDNKNLYQDIVAHEYENVPN